MGIFYLNVWIWGWVIQKLLVWFINHSCTWNAILEIFDKFMGVSGDCAPDTPIYIHTTYSIFQIAKIIFVFPPENLKEKKENKFVQSQHA